MFSMWLFSSSVEKGQLFSPALEFSPHFFLTVKTYFRTVRMHPGVIMLFNMFCIPTFSSWQRRAVNSSWQNPKTGLLPVEEKASSNNF